MFIMEMNTIRLHKLIVVTLIYYILVYKCSCFGSYFFSTLFAENQLFTII